MTIRVNFAYSNQSDQLLYLTYMRKNLLIIALALASLPAANAAGRAAVPDGMCEIVLEAHDVYGNGVSGFQLLLDADHDAYGNSYFGAPGSYNGDYSEFEYRIPENADATGGTSNCVVDGEVSIYVPAGVYDWVTIVPLYEELYVPSGDAAADDFELLAGKTYRFVAGIRPAQFGTEDYISLVLEHDCALTAIGMPATGLDFSSAETISVTVSNPGMLKAEGLTASYSVNGGSPVTETLPFCLEPGENRVHTFSAKADMSAPGDYTVSASVEMEGDMRMSNNSMQQSCRHWTALDLPFSYSFAGKTDSYNLDWIIVDGNGDNSTWEYSENMFNPVWEAGVIYCSSGDDWLISQPLNLAAGTSHVMLNVSAVSEMMPEKLEICYGTSTDPADMKVAATFDISNTEWKTKAANFSVPAAGVYFIGLHCASESGMNLKVADVTVDNGEFVGKPDIYVTKVIAPYSNCDLPSDGKIGVSIENRGTGDLKDFTVSCTVARPDNSVVTLSDQFTDVVAPDADGTFMLNETVDFSATGVYTLNFVITAADGEGGAYKQVECLTPIDELPVLTNFTNDVNTAVWTAMDANGWLYDSFFGDYSAVKHGVDAGLLSRGITLTHPARVKFSYVAGGYFGSTVMKILFGKAGEDPATYSVAYADYDVNQEAKEIEFTIPVDNPGNYSFVIADDGNSEAFLRINEILISEVFGHDLQVAGVEGPATAFMPASFTGVEGTYNVEVINRGTESMSGVVVTASVGGTTAATSSAMKLAAGESATVAMDVKIPQYNQGDTFALEFSVAADAADEYPADNIWTSPLITVTDYMLGVENMTEFKASTGKYGEQLYIGNIYDMAAPSALTSVEIGYCFSDFEDAELEKSLVGLNIYEVSDGKLGRRIYSGQWARGKGGVATVDMQDMLLQPGCYYFEAAQLSIINYGLACINDASGICWNRVDDDLKKVEGYSLAIRAFFGPDAKVYAKDAAALQVLSPEKNSALFSDKETVIATVRNAGYENADFDVELLIDGKSVAKRSLSTAYYEDATVEFADVDLSKAGRHEITVKANLAGDENRANDYVTKTVTSVEPLSPYFMDFEGCNDFDANGDRLNPEWITEDLVGVGSDCFWRYSYRNKNEACGFMAFNINACEPSMADEPSEGFYPYAGDRFGVAFCYDSWAEGAENFEHSDVWLVSPYLELGSGSHFELYVKTKELESMESKLEPYQLLVSEEEEGYDSFKVLGEGTRLAPEEWTLDTADLSAYDNKKVRVAVRYIGEKYVNFCLMIDNLSIATSFSGLDGVNDTDYTLSYNGRALLSSHASDIAVYSADGRCVGFGTNVTELDVTHLPAGIYIARTQDSSLKFVVTK